MVTGSGILIGIIDTGIRLEESLFLYEDGSSKVVSLWDQSDQSGIRPEGFLYGTEWTREEISEGIKRKIKSSPEMRMDMEHFSQPLQPDEKISIRDFRV